MHIFFSNRIHLAEEIPDFRISGHGCQKQVSVLGP
jgi:hypothetical protein